MNNVVVEAFKSKISVVESIRGGMSDDAKSTLANVLNNTNKALSDLKAIRNYNVKNESLVDGVPASQYNSIDWFPEHSIDMVSAIYASQIIDDIVSVQSIDSPLGVIRFLQYTYGNTRGNAKKDGIAIDQWGAMRGADAGIMAASERISEETVKNEGGASVTGFMMHLPVKVKPETPIDIHNESAMVTYRARRNHDDDPWVVGTVDSDGHFSELKPASGGTAPTFEVNPESGEFTLNLGTTGTFGATDTVSLTYFQDLSHVPSETESLELRLRTEVIKAVPHKIRANFAFDASYALSKVHGINVEEALVNACTAEIRQERDNEVVSILMRQAKNTSTWDRQVTSYISQHEHDLSFLSEIFACASKINFETKRGFGNWVVVGRIGLNIIKSAGSDHFKATGATLPNNGAFVVGEIEGQIKVIYSPYVPEDSYLVGYKGSDMDAGFVVADFLPITKTDLVMLDDFVGRQGLISYYGVKMLNPAMYVRGKILNGEIGRH
jgi:hypothetical protein